MAKRKVAREIWRAIPWHAGWEASTFGRIRSIPRYVKRTYTDGHTDVLQFFKGRILKPTISASRYPMVALTGNTKICVHSIILHTFRGPPPIGKIARHLDGNERNNKLSNLRYGTRKQNWEDSIAHGKAQRGERSHNTVLTEKLVREIRASNDSYDVLSKKYKLKKNTILNVRCRRTWAWLK